MLGTFLVFDDIGATLLLAGDDLKESAIWEDVMPVCRGNCGRAVGC